MAISVMTVGAIAIFSMQNVTATGSRRSRIVTTATEVNRFWMERVKLEALRWGPRPHTHPSMAWLDALPPRARVERLVPPASVAGRGTAW
jgi:hypothetical protein